MKPQRDPIIRMSRLTLRLLRESDADDLVAGLGDAAVSQMLARVPMRSSLARGKAVLHIDTVLTRARYQALAR